jgi:hypothetical protein
VKRRSFHVACSECQFTWAGQEPPATVLRRPVWDAPSRTVRWVGEEFAPPRELVVSCLRCGHPNRVTVAAAGLQRPGPVQAPVSEELSPRERVWRHLHGLPEKVVQ